MAAAAVADEHNTTSVLALPKLKILQSVIASVPIDVMDCFGRQERSAECISHHAAVLKNVATRLCVRMGRLELGEVSPNSEDAPPNATHTAVAAVSTSVRIARVHSPDSVGLLADLCGPSAPPAFTDPCTREYLRGDRQFVCGHPRAAVMSGHEASGEASVSCSAHVGVPSNGCLLPTSAFAEPSAGKDFGGDGHLRWHELSVFELDIIGQGS